MQNLISINDLVANATTRGVSFGGANPRLRLAYLTKLGLIPNATKKKLNGKLVGHYPISTLEVLDQIEKSKAAGLAYRDIRPGSQQSIVSSEQSGFAAMAATLFAGIILGILISRFVLFEPAAKQTQASLLVPISQAQYKGTVDNLMKVIKSGEISIPE